MDPIDYVPLPLTPYPSAPASVIISISPVPRTIRNIGPVEVVTPKYRWLGYCIFIVLVLIFSIAAFCYMLYGNHKN
jgi:hypothetical protein